MTPVPYTHTGAAIAFYVALGLFGVLEQRVRWRSWMNRSGSREDHGSLLVVIASVVIGILGAFGLAAAARWAAIPVARSAIFVIGVALMIVGIAIRQWAITRLGRFFTVDVRVQDGQAVVETGPYRWVRHPSYTGMLVTLLGLGLALGNWASLAVLAVVPTVGLVIRIRA